MRFRVQLQKAEAAKRRAEEAWDKALARALKNPSAENLKAAEETELAWDHAKGEVERASAAMLLYGSH